MSRNWKGSSPKENKLPTGETRLPDRLLDTNALGAAMKAHADFERYLWQVRNQGRLFTSVIVEGEVRFGLERLQDGRKKRALTGMFTQVLDRMDGVLPVTRQAVQSYSMVKSALWSIGKPMGENDLWIASSALAEGLILVTNDGLFGNIAGLETEDWFPG
jgi:tRNA(fMet)-specific endonuclease VapC